MSYSDFKSAMKLAPQCEYFTTDGGKSQDEIAKSEELLELAFSKQCKEFYQEFGYLSFYGSEIFGIDPYDETDILEGNSVTYALHDRKEYNLPQKWIPIYDFDDGYLAYLDYDHLNEENEPRVIMCIYNGKEYEISEVIAEDFGEFLLELVQEALE